MDDSFSAYNFFSYTIGLILIIVATVLYKIVFRTEWRDPNTADLGTGRAVLTAEDIRRLDVYYGMPRWRRVGTYLRMW